jgi:hypothetical protein
MEMDSRDESGAMLIEEAMALAVAGRHGEALSVLTGRGRIRSGRRTSTRASSRGAAGAGAPARAARNGRRPDAARAICSARWPVTAGALAWRARLELARIARVERRYEEAAGHLQHVLAAFRGDDRTGERSERPIRGSRRWSRARSTICRRRCGRLGRRRRRAAPGSAARTSGDLLDPRSLLRLVELGKRLATESEPDTVLGSCSTRPSSLTGAQRGFLVLVKDEGKEEGYEFALAENIDRTENPAADLRGEPHAQSAARSATASQCC